MKPFYYFWLCSGRAWLQNSGAKCSEVRCSAPVHVAIRTLRAALISCICPVVASPTLQATAALSRALLLAPLLCCLLGGLWCLSLAAAFVAACTAVSAAVAMSGESKDGSAGPPPPGLPSLSPSDSLLQYLAIGRLASNKDGVLLPEKHRLVAHNFARKDDPDPEYSKTVKVSEEAARDRAEAQQALCHRAPAHTSLFSTRCGSMRLRCSHFSSCSLLPVASQSRTQKSGTQTRTGEENQTQG